ncbi:MAG: CBS domain-containing protein [Gemmataceae bacterium]
MELTRNLKIDSISRLEPTPPRLIESDRPVSYAVDRMRDYRTGCLLVTRQGKLVGIFTERDLLHRVLAMGLPLNVPMMEVMTANPVTVDITDPIRSAIRKMQQGEYRHLPVVDIDGRPLGVISAKRIIRYIASHYPNTIYALPDTNVIPETPEGA